ncbi:hypothetical protein F4810DRAFT_718499 [Camillea tinctor]|nr:hypothetical protein F4810DRAFT_718499 [Camillea tinctor]
MAVPGDGGNLPTHSEDMSDELRAMMADLGNARLEECARDDEEVATYGPSREAARVLALTPVQPSNPGAAAYHDAIARGEFEDDDALGVRGLDSIDNGNRHRIRKLEEALHGNGSRSRGPMGNPSSHNPGSRGGFVRAPIRYDPQNPGFRSKKHPPTLFKSKESNQGISSLGGLIPPGGEVKRWDHNKASELASHPFQPSASASPLTVERALSNGSGSESPVLTGTTLSPPSRPMPGTVSTANTVNSQQIHEAASHQDPSEAIPPPQRPDPTATDSNLDDKVQNNQVEPSNGQNFTGQDAWKNTTYTAREIFFGAECIKRIGPPKPSWVWIYELSDQEICLWELHIKDELIIYEDIRQLLEPGIRDQNVVLYRQNISGLDDTPYAHHLDFGSETSAGAFVKALALRNAQFAESNEPIFMGHTQSMLVPDQEPGEQSLIDISQSRLTELSTPQLTPGYGTYHDDLHSLENHFSEMDTANNHSVIESEHSEEKPEEEEHRDNYAGVSFRYLSICPDVLSIDTVSVGMELSNESLRILSRVKPEEYRDMTLTFHILVDRMYEFLSTPKDSPAFKFAAAQIASLHLARDQEFGALSKSERNRAIAVVYRNILNLFSGRITWTSRELLSFRPSQKVGCPREVSEFNAMNEQLWKLRGRTPSPEQFLYTSAKAQKNAVESTQFLYGNEGQGDVTPASTSGSQESKDTQSAMLTFNSPLDSPQGASTPRPLPGLQNSQALSRLRQEEYVTSSSQSATQTPNGTSSVPRTVAQANAQASMSRLSSNGSSPTGLAASRWNSPQVTPKAVLHQRTGSNASTRSTISRLAHSMATL